MTSKNLEEKTQEQKEIEAEIDLTLIEVGIDIYPADPLKLFRQFNSRKNNGYNQKSYGESYGN